MLLTGIEPASLSARDPRSRVFANFTTEACCQFSFLSPLTTTDAPDTILVPLLLLNLPYSQVAVNSILVLVMGLEPTLRIRKLCLRQPSIPIRVHQQMGVYGLWASMVRYTPNLKIRFKPP